VGGGGLNYFQPKGVLEESNRGKGVKEGGDHKVEFHVHGEKEGANH